MGRALAIAAVVLTCCLIVAASQDAEATQYRVIDLGTLPGGTDSVAHGINNKGQIVGWTGTSSTAPRAVLWENGTVTGILTGQAAVCQAYDINDNGQLVGQVGPVGFTWQYGTDVNDVTYLYGFREDGFVAADINESGQVAGAWAVYACLWQNNAYTVLGTAPYGVAQSLNNVGQVVGNTPGGSAFLWQEDAYVYLEALPGGVGTNATGMNDNGQIVGSAADSTGLVHPCLWQNGTTTDLGGVGWANSVNNVGQVVGLSGDRAFLWQNGTMQYLDALGGTSSGAYDINDRGEVVGYACDTGGTQHAVLWQPIPEPSSILTLAAGLASLLGARRRRG